MANYNKEGDIVVKEEFNNIFIVNPNQEYAKDGSAVDRNIKQEDLVMYANLEANVQPRSRLLISEDGDLNVNLIATSNINFLRPNGQDYLTTKWTSSFTNNTQSQTWNSELLGITNISYSVNTSFTPKVIITLEDVQGRALFEPGDESVYSSFFNLPYPIFYLTLKGYYGKTVRYPLLLQTFNASLNQTSGNFQINLTFIGYKFTVLTDLMQADLISLPHMYLKNNNNNVVSPVSKTGGQNGELKNTSGNNAYLGNQYLKEVYETYKQLKVIDQNFPILTVPQLLVMLENLTTDTLKRFGEENADDITNLDNYANVLTEYRQKVYAGQFSWFDTNTDKKYFFVIRDEKNQKNIKYYKPDNLIASVDYYNSLKAVVNTYNTKLVLNPLMGDGGIYSFKRIPALRNLTIFNTDKGPEDFVSQVNVIETLKERTGKDKFTDTEIDAIKTEVQIHFEMVKNLNEQLQKKQKPPVPVFYFYDGPNGFKEVLNDIDKVFPKIKDKIENELTEKFTKLLESPKGLGFRPTIRNIAAVIMASSEAMLRILTDVHKKAFDKRDDTDRKRSVSLTSYPDLNTNITNSPVFPWPLFTTENETSKGDKKYLISYPGDPKFVGITNGDDYNVWPEVEFVEQYVKGFLQRQLPPTNPVIEESGIYKFLINGYDTPPTNIPYSDLQIIKFFYEMYDRIFALSYYQGFVRNEYDEILNLLSDAELNNILTEIINSDEIRRIFKEETLNLYVYFLEYLKVISSAGQGENFQKLIRGVITNEFLNTELIQSVKVLDEDLPPINLFSKYETSLENYLKSQKTNKEYFTDIYPFISKVWNKSNIPSGELNNLFIEVNQTSKSLFYNSITKKISNYKSADTIGDGGDKKFNRPFTDFSIFNNNDSIPVNTLFLYPTKTNQVNPFYSLTEVKLDYLNHNGSLTNLQTTSLLNTPFFVNAIMGDITNHINGAYYPYITSAYLFLQSLPYATLREKYKSEIEGNFEIDLDFIASTMKKFGSVHSLPTMWILKLGAIWHRYKIWNDSNVDILTDVWTNIPKLTYYDPVNQNPNKQYSFVQVPNGDNLTFSDVNITLQTQITTANIVTTIMNVGFYPEVINNFYYFIVGEKLYNDVNEINSSLQNAISRGDIFIYSPSESNINRIAYNSNLNNLNLKTWSVLFRDKNNEGNYIVCPSFGSVSNQIESECFDGQNLLTNEIYNNDSVFDASIRIMWGKSNFGYFDLNAISKPEPNQYFKIINSKSKKQTPANLSGVEEYTTIEEIFSIFTADQLDTLENKFLEFCRPNYGSQTEFNFQNILSKTLNFATSPTGATQYNIIKDVQNGHNNYVSSELTKYINRNSLLKISNPTNFNIQEFNYFITGSTAIVNQLGDLPKYKQLTPNALPFDGGNITLITSQTNYPEEWKCLKKYVGFSSVSALTYTDNGSYITDFFIDNDIAFTTGNTVTFQNLIKIYASQKLIKEVNNNTEFKEKLRIYFNDVLKFQNVYYRDLYGKIRGSLSKDSSSQNKKSDVVGESTKIELYDRFKALNDKWISANDYRKVNLFSDVLFLDRANRDIGDKVILDVFKIKKYLTSDPTTNVETILRSIFLDNNFNVMSLPSYVNFYGIPTPTGNDVRDSGLTGSNLANYLFKNYTEVDYQNSRNKLLCYYSSPSSEHLAIRNDVGGILNGWNNDSWYLDNPTNNPVNENQDGKDDFALSNKVVGFYVDFGLQNQSVFKNFSIQQDIGKATSESVKLLYDMRNLKDGTQSATQDVSLYNVYKSRAYQAEIISMGNAMIQPMMYFILRNVPLFSGPYLIQSVSHTITDGNFETRFSGTRQRIQEYPVENIFLQNLKNSFLSNLKKDLNQKQNSESENPTNIIAAKNEITNSVNLDKKPSQTEICTPNDLYSFFVPVTPTEITYNFLEIGTHIVNSGIPLDMRRVVFALFFLESKLVNNNSLSCFNYNFAGIPLNVDFGGNLAQFLQKQFVCLTEKDTTTAYAVFGNITNCINFVNAKYRNGFKNRITNFSDIDVFSIGFSRAYIEIFPNVKPNSNQFFNEYVNSNQDIYNLLLVKVRQSFVVAQAIGL